MTIQAVLKDWNHDRMYAFYVIQCGHTITWTNSKQQIQETYKQSLETAAVASKPTMATRIVDSVRSSARSISSTRRKR